MCPLESALSSTVLFFIAFIGVVLLAIKRNQAFYKKSSEDYLTRQKDMVNESLRNQQDMIALLREIRDAVKK